MERVVDIIDDFKILNDEDPSLNISWNEKTRELLVGIMGLIQIEVITEIIKNRFGYVISFGEPSLIYKETIEGIVVGYGHFEPLKYYAEVHLEIKGNDSDEIKFKSIVSPDDLSIGNQNLIKHHIFEKLHNGILTGSALTGLDITLITGRGHNEHTSGGDFREATIRALRQGLENANNILLEPIYLVKIIVKNDYLGRVMTDIKKAYGEFDNPIQSGDEAIIIDRVPVATFKNYSTELSKITGGKGKINLKLHGYKPCHNQSEVIEKSEYKKNLDVEYPSSSIFCKKGKDIIVK